MRKFSKIASSLILAIFVVVAVGLVVSTVAGLKVFTITSGSMEPAYKTGSLIFVKEVKPDELKKGDVITFAIADDMTATHRIVSIKGSGSDLRITTKGDANEDADAGGVRPENLVGKPVFKIPYVGYPVAYIMTPPWKYIAIAIVVILIVSSIISTVMGRKR